MNDVARAACTLLLLVLTASARGEICRFRADDAENPFRRWLASQEVTCVAAGTRLEFPEGLWNVFARAEGAVSALPLLVEGGGAPTSVAPELGPGATVAPFLPEKHTGVLYAPRRGSAFPVDGPRVTVPADEPLWLFVLDKTTPVALIPIAPIPPRSERTVDARSGGPPSIVGWLQLPEPDRRALADAPRITSPSIRAGSRDAEPLPEPPLLHGAFFRVPDVAPGTAELRVEGRGWIPDRRVVKVQPGVTVAPVPLFVRGAATLVVHWNTHQDLPALDRSVGSCDPDDAPQLTIAISKCSTPRPGAEECTPVREEKVERFFGSMAFEDVAPGLYRAEMRYGKLPPSSSQASAGPLSIVELRVFASYMTTYGSVTRGGEPIGEEVRIQFPGGGIGYAPEETDEYRAVLRPAVIGTDAQIAVAACDGSPRSIVLAEQPVFPNRRFNIDIPVNELTVRVSDTFTREALPGATVKLDAISRVRQDAAFTTKEAANEHGDVVWTGVPVREIQLTVTHAGYEKRIVPSFTMVRSGKHAVDVQLVPLRGTHGRIVSDRPFDNAAVVWFSPAGAETERADLAADGTFVYANRHTAEETLAVVSASHPLWVLRAPATEARGGITLRFPAAPAVAFDVWLAAAVLPHETRHIGIAIGGVRVPQPVLAQHQTLRRDPPHLRGSGPQHFRDLLATGPLDVLLGPLVEEVATGARTLDVFALPKFANPPRERLEPGTADVVFTVK